MHYFSQPTSPLTRLRKTFPWPNPPQGWAVVITFQILAQCTRESFCFETLCNLLVLTNIKIHIFHSCFAQLLQKFWQRKILILVISIFSEWLQQALDKKRKKKKETETENEKRRKGEIRRGKEKIRRKEEKNRMKERRIRKRAEMRMKERRKKREWKKEDEEERRKREWKKEE